MRISDNQFHESLMPFVKPYPVGHMVISAVRAVHAVRSSVRTHENENNRSSFDEILDAAETVVRAVEENSGLEY